MAGCIILARMWLNHASTMMIKTLIKQPDFLFPDHKNNPDIHGNHQITPNLFSA